MLGILHDLLHRSHGGPGRNAIYRRKVFGGSINIGLLGFSWFWKHVALFFRAASVAFKNCLVP